MSKAVCSKCGKPLTDAISVAYKLGPVCRVKKKTEGMNNGNLFANRSEYTYDVEGGILWIEESKGSIKSVTNDIENVLADIAKDHDISTKKIMYKDSDGIWDQVTATITTKGKNVSVTNLEFFPLTETNFGKAKEKLLAK